jgi:stage II sporulation protein D
VLVEGRGRRYRGTVEAKAEGGGLRLVNRVDVEDYLRGMGEVRDGSWPQEALKVQAVAARTYALRAMARVGEVCDDERCQVYLGAGAEYPQMDQAVAATRSQVLTYGGDLAATVYSANAGGVTADTEEGFGTPSTNYPYLRSAPYPSRDPNPWIIRADLAEVGQRLGYPGRLTEPRVYRTGPSKRVIQMLMEGDSGPVEMSGLAAMARLGLRSNLFTIRLASAAPEGAEALPAGESFETLAPPADAPLVQRLPDEAPIGFSRIVAQASSARLGSASGGGRGIGGQLLRAVVLLSVGGLVLGRRRLLDRLIDR